MRTTTTKKTETGEEVKAVTRVAVPSKMTAAVLYGSEDLRIEKIDVPALAADEVLLRVRLALTDGTDLKVWKRGYHAKMIQPPAVFGHELVGEIVAVGKRVDSRWRIGMRKSPPIPLRACVATTAAAARKIFATTCCLTTARTQNTCASPGASSWKTCSKCRTLSTTRARRSPNLWPACFVGFMRWKCAPAIPRPSLAAAPSD